MFKPIPRPVHAVLDYSYAALFIAAPKLIGYEKEKNASDLSQLVSGGVFLTSLFTSYELGLVKVVPFKMHLTADVAVGFLTMAAPFLFGFADNRRARNFFIGMGAFSVLAGLITEPQEMKNSEI